MNKVVFGKTEACLITDQNLTNEIFKKISELYDNTKLKRDYFPGPQPVSIERDNITQKLKKNRYVVCEKTDGERYLLITLVINHSPLCCVINRKNECYFVTMNIKQEMFEGSVFDGELIKSVKDGEWNFIIHDCFVYNGVVFMKEHHNVRYNCVLDFVKSRYSQTEKDAFIIKSKNFYSYGPEIDKTWQHIQETSENKIDGLIFTPVESPVQLGRQWDLYKWKSGNNHTIDLLVKKGVKTVTLYGLGDNNKNYILKTLNPNDQSYKNIIDFLQTTKKNTKEFIIEFGYDPVNDVFIPIKERPDKLVPNSKLTITNTFKNIKESLQITDFT